jgi:2-succinyl-6-hydroxy-2,4-cyclohexadiene-1-carboxylate synthase
MTTILLHGFSGDKSSWDEVCRYWQPQPAALAVDLPGHGESASVSDGWQSNLAELQRRLGPMLAEATVVGYSLGARVALGLVAAGMARQAVLIGVNPGIGAAEREQRRRSDAEWAQVLRRDGIEGFAARWEAQPLFASQQRARAESRHHRQRIRRAQSADALARSLEEMGLAAMPDYRDRISGLVGQLHLIVGSQDSKFRALAEAMVSEVPGLPLQVIDDCGHDVALERPHELAHQLAAIIPSRAA